MSDFITSDDELSYDYDDFEYEEEFSEDVIEEASESELEPVNALPYTVHRQKYIIRIKDYEYY